MFLEKQILAVSLLLLTGIVDALPEHPPKPTTLKTTKIKTTKTSTTAQATTSSTPSAIPGGHLPPNGPLPPGGEYRIGMVVFPGFTPLDVFGPLEALNGVGFNYYLNLSVIAETYDPVETHGDYAWFSPRVNGTHTQTIVPTHTFDNANFPLDLLIVPGGGGTRAPIAYINSTVEFIKRAAPQSKYILSVCTGASLVARAGLLNGKRATTNKKAWAFVTSTGPLVKWVAVARWVIDGNIWSSRFPHPDMKEKYHADGAASGNPVTDKTIGSGVSAGTDATLAWINHVYGNATAQASADNMEWMGDWHNSDHDEYALKAGLSPANNTNGA